MVPRTINSSVRDVQEHLYLMQLLAAGSRGMQEEQRQQFFSQNHTNLGASLANPEHIPRIFGEQNAVAEFQITHPCNTMLLEYRIPYQVPGMILRIARHNIIKCTVWQAFMANVVFKKWIVSTHTYLCLLTRG